MKQEQDLEKALQIEKKIESYGIDDRKSVV